MRYARRAIILLHSFVKIYLYTIREAEIAQGIIEFCIPRDGKN